MKELKVKEIFFKETERGFLTPYFQLEDGRTIKAVWNASGDGYDTYFTFVGNDD